MLRDPRGWLEAERVAGSQGDAAEEASGEQRRRRQPRRHWLRSPLDAVMRKLRPGERVEEGQMGNGFVAATGPQLGGGRLASTPALRIRVDGFSGCIAWEKEKVDKKIRFI
jgi:hypothetical protein